MANYNRVILAGNLTRDPQLSYLPSQTPVVEFGIAVNRRWRSQDGQPREETMFIDCRCFGRQAEVFNQYMTKGRPVLIEGRLDLDTWEGKDGQRRSKHRVFVQNFQFLGGGGGGGGAGGGTQQSRPQQQRPAPQQSSQQPPRSYEDYPDEPPASEDQVTGDDIPF